MDDFSSLLNTCPNYIGFQVFFPLKFPWVSPENNTLNATDIENIEICFNLNASSTEDWEKNEVFVTDVLYDHIWNGKG
jgi:hypothetical protein